MKTKTRSLALTAILAAITLVLGILPIGYITIIPGFIEITIMCIPVIIGSLVLGWRAGVMLGGVFALTSIIAAFRSVLGVMLLEANAAAAIVVLVVPRLMVPIVAYLVYRWVHTKSDAVNLGIACAAGSLTNTVLFLLLLKLMFADVVGETLFTYAAAINGSIEAVVAVAIGIPVIRALKKSVPPIIQPKRGEAA